MIKKLHPSAICHRQFAIRSSLSFFLTFLSLLSNAGCHRKSTPEIISIGHVGSFQGPDKLNGEHAKRGIELALDEAQGSDGTVNDRRLEVIHVEEPSTARLAIINKVWALLGGTDNAQAAKMEGLARTYETPLIISAGMP